MRGGILGLLGAYLALVLAAGLIFKRRVRTLEDFFLASRNLPGSLIFVSLTAAWFGATSILVTTDEAYRSGVSAAWLVGIPAVLTVLFIAVVLVKPFRRLPAMTIPDLIELRYGRAVRHFASLLIAWYMVLLAASQMVAFGQFVQAFLGWPYLPCLALGTAVVLVYSISGGLRSVVFTDIVQFVLLTAGAAALVIFLAGRAAWPDVVRAVPAGERTRYLSLAFDLKRHALIALSFFLAWTISPIALQRIQAARDVRAARSGLFVTAATLSFLYGAVVLAGMLSAAVFSGRPLDGPLVSRLIALEPGSFFGGLVFSAVMAAVLSTMDTAINTGALSVSRDLVRQVKPFSGMSEVLVSRLATLAVGVLAFLVATRFQSILKTIGLASEIMAEGLFVPGLAMIFLKRRIPLAGLLSLSLGAAFSIVSFLTASNVLPAGLPTWPDSVPWGLALSLTGFGVGLALERLKGRPQLD